MFYSQFILAKKGPLGTIWIAAHLERKLRKNQVADTDIGVSVDSILSPDVPIALRLSSHLLLGVVRIYNRKVNYLFDDCSEALLKVKQAFRSTAVDLPPEQSKAPYHSITLPETFDLDDFELPENDVFQGNYVDHHVSSREQITLQDTMDGVALSTSRFGLDERFGDADTSGVDLDEELFLSKVGTSGNVDVSADPQSSSRIMVPMKHDHRDVVSPNLEPLNDGVDEDVDLMDDAQAPRTPGLLEEPNLSNAQERSACEDHFETDERHLTDATIKDSEKISGEKYSHDQNKHVDDCSIPDMNSVTVLPMTSEDQHHSSDLDVRKLQVVTSEEKSLDYHDSASGPSSHVENHSSSLSELAKLGHDEIAEKKKDNVDSNGSLGHNERSDEGCLEKSSHDLLQNVPTSIENLVNVDMDSQEKAEDQTYKEPRVLSVDSNVSIVDEQFQVLMPCKANQGSNLKGHQCDDPKPFNENGTPSPVQVSGAEDTLHGFEMSGMAQGEATFEGKSRDPGLEGLSHGAGGISSAVDNAASTENLLENAYSSRSPDLLSPEKLRSVIDGAENDPGSLNMDFTPGYMGRNDDGDAGSNFISGKKRTYTESTLTEQSLYTVEFSGISHSKRTVESIPDDGDLLSSILAGRKSSVLKVKPTPSPREMTSVKRRRSSGTTKRKVLIDDSMVLHGDTIRRQLMNTEDIRRVRKKAPCTRPEISMIEKQFLAEEMFTEPICSGLSMDLASLHNQTHDLGGIVISVEDVDYASLELATKESLKYNNDMLSTEATEGSSLQEVRRESEKEGEKDFSVDICDQDTIDAPVPLDTQDGNCISSLHDNVIESKLNTSTNLEKNQSLHELPDDLADTEFDGKPGSVADVVNTTAVGSAIPSELVSGDYVDISADLARVAPSYEARTPDLNIMYGDATLHNDATWLSRDQKADEVSVETTCEIGVEGGKDTDKDIGSATAVEFVPDDQILETAEGNAIVETEACFNSSGMEYAVHTVLDKETEQIGSFPMDMDLHMEDVLLDGRKFPGQDDGDYSASMAEMDRSGCDYADMSYSIADNETEFLNFDDDDDELVEAADDHIPNKDASLTDNSGWSSRTRAVANYLQGVFVKQGGSTRRTVTIDNLLVGKTRKEASRMFFEALVLKTKDYLDVEQVHPFDNISIRPQAKLMKSEF